MKILFIAPSLGYGGAMKNLVFVANALSRTHDVCILLYESSTIMQPVTDSVKLYIIPKHSTKKIIKRFIDIYRIYWEVKKIKPDIILSFLNFPNLYSVVVGKLLSIPVIISERGDPFQRQGKFDHFFDFFFNRADGAVFQTEGAQSYFGSRLRRVGVVIPNPIMRRVVCDRHVVNDSHKIAFVGRFELRQKRQDLMLEAFRAVQQKYADAQLFFYGTGADECLVRQMVVSYGLEQSVIFSGYIANPEREVVKAEVFVMTSDYEGIPNVLVESMMLGMPVISTDCSPGGAKLLIQDEKNGILVERGNASAIADAILLLFESRALREALSANAVSICDDFRPELIVSKWEEYITSICDGYNGNEGNGNNQ